MEAVFTRSAASAAIATDRRLAPHRLDGLDAHGEDVGHCQPAPNSSALHYRPASVLAHPGRQGRPSRIQPPSRPVLDEYLAGR